MLNFNPREVKGKKMYGFKRVTSFLFVLVFSFVNFSSAQEVTLGDSKPKARFERVVFEDSDNGVNLEGLERVLDVKKNQIKSGTSYVQILSFRQLPGVKLSDIIFDVKANELKLKSDGSIFSERKLKSNVTVKEVAKLINGDELGVIWLKVKVFGYKYEDASGKPIPTRPDSGAFKAIPNEREAYFIIDAKYMEVDDELNIVKLPPFVTEVGLSVYKGQYDTMDLRKFGGFTSSVFKRSSEFYDKDRKMFALEDSWKNGKLLCKKGEIIGYYDPIFNAY